MRQDLKIEIDKRVVSYHEAGMMAIKAAELIQKDFGKFTHPAHTRHLFVGKDVPEGIRVTYNDMPKPEIASAVLNMWENGDFAEPIASIEHKKKTGDAITIQEVIEYDRKRSHR